MKSFTGVELIKGPASNREVGDNIELAVEDLAQCVRRWLESIVGPMTYETTRRV